MELYGMMTLTSLQRKNSNSSCDTKIPEWLEGVGWNRIKVRCINDPVEWGIIDLIPTVIPPPEWIIFKKNDNGSVDIRMKRWDIDWCNGINVLPRHLWIVFRLIMCQSHVNHFVTLWKLMNRDRGWAYILHRYNGLNGMCENELILSNN